LGVRVRQKVKGKGNPWWIFISHNKKQTSRKVGDKQAAEEVASIIRATSNLESSILRNQRKRIPSRNMQHCGFHCFMIGKNQHGKIICIT
jgi:hypothetical protein